MLDGSVGNGLLPACLTARIHSSLPECHGNPSNLLRRFLVSKNKIKNEIDFLFAFVSHCRNPVRFSQVAQFFRCSTILATNDVFFSSSSNLTSRSEKSISERRTLNQVSHSLNYEMSCGYTYQRVL